MRTAQSNFSKGEIAPQLYGRFDVDSYQAGVRIAQNMFIVKYGGLSKRVGTRLVYELSDPDMDYRLFPFSFNQEQSYALVMGELCLNVAALGGMVLEVELAVTAATQTNPVQLTIPFHGYAVGDEIYPKNVPGMTELNDRFWTVMSVIDDNNFTIDADGTEFTAFSGTDSGTTRIEVPPAPTPAPTPAPAPAPTPPPDTGGGGGGFGPDGNEESSE